MYISNEQSTMHCNTMSKKIHQEKKQDEKVTISSIFTKFKYQGNDRVASAMIEIYLSFMEDNWKLGKKELKRKINDIKDVPAFINNFRWSNDKEAEDLMKLSMQSFLRNHQCLMCKKYSLDKCSNCKLAHYCGQDCQEKDFDRHSKECSIEQKLMSVANRFIETRVIKKDLEIEDEEKNFMNFDSFISSLDFKIFEACFNLITIKIQN